MDVRIAAVLFAFDSGGRGTAASVERPGAVLEGKALPGPWDCGGG